MEGKEQSAETKNKKVKLEQASWEQTEAAEELQLGRRGHGERFWVGDQQHAHYDHYKYHPKEQTVGSLRSTSSKHRLLSGDL